MIRIRCGQWIDYSKSNFFTPEKKFRADHIWCLFWNGMANFISLATNTLAYKFAYIAGMNQGIISAESCFASVFNVIAFYFIYKEKISVAQLVGIFLMLGCVACLSLETKNKDSEVED